MIARLLLMDMHTESLIILCILNAYLSCNFPVDVVFIIVYLLITVSLEKWRNLHFCVSFLIKRNTVRGPVKQVLKYFV